MLVIIHSPACAASEWCARELQLFEAAASARFGGLHAGTMLRVVKINKFPVEGESFVTRMPELKDNTGYPFFRSFEGSPLEFEPLIDGQPGAKFLAAVNGVAIDIVRVLQGNTGLPSGLTVYLADTTHDAAEYREKIRSELERYGHAVLPHRDAATDGANEDAIRTAMRIAKLSVHVVGGETGDASPRSDGRSNVEVQYDIAGQEAARNPGLTRHTWLAPLDEQKFDAGGAAFRKRLRDTDPALVVASLEDVKSQIKALLARKPLPPKPPSNGDVRVVYVMFDASDEERAKPIAKWLFEQGFEVLKPARTGNLMRAHKVNLRDSHGALIYYGEVDDEWLAVKLGDLRKSLGEAMPREKKFRGAVYLADPGDDSKAEFRSRLFDVIPGFGSFRPETLAEFVEKVRGAVEG